jgi:MFS transporter, MHS family, proline/betaine transporter
VPERVDRRTIAAGAIGSVLEWYDFGVYGFLATVLASDYFPTGNAAISLIATFGVFAGGYLMRPIGAIILGHIGDRVSRKAALIVSVLTMTMATGAIALLPTYTTIGIAAPVLLTAFRLVQGLAVGGEYTGAVVLLVETAPPGRRAFIGSLALTSGTVGVLLASGAAALLANLVTAQAFADGGWRLLYAPAPVLGLVGFLLRRGLATEAVAATAKERSIPVVAAFRNHGTALLRVAGLAGMLAVANYMVFIYGTTYLATVAGVARAGALSLTTAGNAFLVAVYLAFGLLADRIGARRMMLAGTVALLVLSYPLFTLLRSGSPVPIMGGLIGFALCLGGIGAGLAVAMCALFPAAVRYTGVSLGYGLAFGILGGTTPLVATTLIDVTGYDLAPAFYVMLAALMGLAALLLTPKSKIDALTEHRSSSARESPASPPAPARRRSRSR